MSKSQNWTMNDNQTKFVAVLKDYPNGATLLEIKRDKGIEFKTGSINTLVSKGLVSAEEERTYECNVVYENQVVGHTKLTRKVYKLVA